MKTKITSDSTCDLSPELIEKYDIDILPIRVTMGDVSVRDGVDFSPESFYPIVEQTGELPKTSALNVSEYHDFFAKWSFSGYSIVHFCIGSKFSSTYQNACIAAEEFENVYVVDSQNLSTGQGLLVLAAAEMAQKGQSADLIYRSSVENAAKAKRALSLTRLIIFTRAAGAALWRRSEQICCSSNRVSRFATVLCFPRKSIAEKSIM